LIQLYTARVGSRSGKKGPDPTWPGSGFGSGYETMDIELTFVQYPDIDIWDSETLLVEEMSRARPGAQVVL